MSRESIELARVRSAAGTLWLPGSKSISNRALLLAALAEGTTRLEALLDSDDTQVMRLALEKLGVRVEPVDGVENVDVHGIGPARGFPVKRARIYVGNSGTSARMLAAVLAMCDGHYELSGVPRMHQRPIGDLVEPLALAGAAIEWEGEPGYPPIAIRPRQPGPVATMRIRGNVSSQFLTGLLVALPVTGEHARVEVEGELVSKPYVEMTLDLMAHFGVPVTREEWEAFEIRPGSAYRSPGRFNVEGDASSASYFLAAGAIGGGPVRVEGVGRASVQGDVQFVSVLESMGARVKFGDKWIEASGRPPLKRYDLDFNRIPDAAMTAAVLALFASGTSRLRNIGSWRVKETDRIAAMARELRKFGAIVEEGPDFLSITPPASFLEEPAEGLAPVSIDTYDDHRMAMCFSLAAFGPGPVRIMDPDCVAKTFPAYFEAFERLVS